MPTLNGDRISVMRRDLLAKIEMFAAETLADLKRRPSVEWKFANYAEFFSPSIFGLVAWEQIHPVDLVYLPNVKQLFVQATKAARSRVTANSSRSGQFNFGQGRRSFAEIGEVALAGNVLPRLERILHCWGIDLDETSDTIKETKPSEGQYSRLASYLW